MSIKVMTRIWQESRQHGGALLVLLAIGDFADDDGVAYPAVVTLAQKARLSESQTHRILRQLQNTWEIEVHRGAGPKGCNLYKVKPLLGLPEPPQRGSIMPGVALSEGVPPMRLGGAAHAPRGVAPVAPEPSLEPSIEPSSVPKSQKRPKRITVVDDTFREQMRQRFGSVFGDTLQERIDEALGHQSARKYDDLQAYIRGWLRRDAERLATRRDGYQRPKDNLEKLKELERGASRGRPVETI